MWTEEKKREYVFTLRKKMVDLRENKSKGPAKEKIINICDTGFYVLFGEETDISQISRDFLERATTGIISARYSVWASDPKEAVETVLVDHDLSLKSGALTIDIARILEVPECCFLRKNEKEEFVCGELGHMCKIEQPQRERLGSCILYSKDENEVCVPAGLISFSYETIKVKREIFNFIRTNGP